MAEVLSIIQSYRSSPVDAVEVAVVVDVSINFEALLI